MSALRRLNLAVGRLCLVVAGLCIIAAAMDFTGDHFATGLTMAGAALITGAAGVLNLQIAERPRRGAHP